MNRGPAGSHKYPSHKRAGRIQSVASRHVRLAGSREKPGAGRLPGSFETDGGDTEGAPLAEVLLPAGGSGAQTEHYDVSVGQKERRTEPLDLLCAV